MTPSSSILQHHPGGWGGSKKAKIIETILLDRESPIKGDTETETDFEKNHPDAQSGHEDAHSKKQKTRTNQ